MNFRKNSENFLKNGKKDKPFSEDDMVKRHVGAGQSVVGQSKWATESPMSVTYQKRMDGIPMDWIYKQLQINK